MKRTRVRAVSRWTALVTLLLLAAATVASYWWYVAASIAAEDNGYRIFLQHGKVIFDMWESPKTDGRYFGDWRINIDPASSWSWTGHAWPPRFYEDEMYRGLIIPAWLLLALLAFPTAWLWSRDRRFVPPGCCRTCKYDLTGNTTGICPECGRPRERPA
jgi:hypothetical protein